MGERTKFKITSTITLELWGEYEGAVVEMRRTTLGDYIEWRRLISLDAGTLEEDERQAQDMITWLGKRLVSWNLEDDEGDIAATAQALARQDPVLIKTIGAAYTAKIGRVPLPLDRPSTDGSRFPEESIPMEIS
jgi:hypothetical protein